MKLKVAQARRYELAQRRAIVGEIDGLLASLESITRSRYAGGLAAQADVFLTNLPLSARARLGIDHKTICALNPSTPTAT